MIELNERQKQILVGKICPYCGQPTEFVDSVEIYGTSYGMMYWNELHDCVKANQGTDV